MKQLNTYEETEEIDDFKDMYLDCTDPIRIAESERKYKIEKGIKEKQSDTGL